MGFAGSRLPISLGFEGCPGSLLAVASIIRAIGAIRGSIPREGPGRGLCEPGDARFMKVRGKLGAHRPPVTRDQHTPGVLGPAKDVGVGRGELKIGKVADPGDIDRRRGTRVMAQDRSPEIAAEMLVEQIAEGHGSRPGRGPAWSHGNSSRVARTMNRPLHAFHRSSSTPIAGEKRGCYADLRIVQPRDARRP
jgi:hypothetical protein